MEYDLFSNFVVAQGPLAFASFVVTQIKKSPAKRSLAGLGIHFNQLAASRPPLWLAPELAAARPRCGPPWGYLCSAAKRPCCAKKNKAQPSGARLGWGFTNCLVRN